MCQHRLNPNIRRVVSDAYGQSVELRFEMHSPQCILVTNRLELEQEAQMPFFRWIHLRENGWVPDNINALQEHIA